MTLNRGNTSLTLLIETYLLFTVGNNNDWDLLMVLNCINVYELLNGGHQDNEFFKFDRGATPKQGYSHL